MRFSVLAAVSVAAAAAPAAAAAGAAAALTYTHGGATQQPAATQPLPWALARAWLLQTVPASSSDLTLALASVSRGAAAPKLGLELQDADVGTGASRVADELPAAAAAAAAAAELPRPAFLVDASDIDLGSLADLWRAPAAGMTVWSERKLVEARSPVPPEELSRLRKDHCGGDCGLENDDAFLTELLALEQATLRIQQGKVDLLVISLTALQVERPAKPRALERASSVQEKLLAQMEQAFSAAHRESAVVVRFALPSAVDSAVQLLSADSGVRKQKRALDSSCPQSVSDCQTLFANCSHHGVCTSRQYPSKVCYFCSCTSTKWTDDNGNAVPNYDGPVAWTGDSCQYQDVSAAFHLVFWLTIAFSVVTIALGLPDRTLAHLPADAWMPDAGFFVSHARVALGVDFGYQSLQGIVEYTISPLVPVLRELKFNCRQCDIVDVTINGIPASFVLLDPTAVVVQSAKCGLFYEAPEFHLDAARRADTEELQITVPPGLECEMINSSQSQTAAGTAGYQSWTVRIEYVLAQPQVAVKFNGMSSDPLSPKMPHMMLFNPNVQARWWMPCIDKIHDRLTFDFEITIPRTVGDALGEIRVPFSLTPLERDMLRRREADRALEMVALCSGELVEHFVHPADPSKSVWIFAARTAINVSSILISVGPFEAVPIVGWGRPSGQTLRNGEPTLGDDEAFETSVQRSGGKGTVFVLPQYKRDVRATTFFLPQALEFFEQWVAASFPYSSFNVVFVEENHCSVLTGSTMVLASVDLLVDESLIDQVYESRYSLTRALASQWFGHYMAPNRWTDTWVIVGFANYMASQFMRKMFGNNEFKYRIQQDVERVCTLDVNQPPLCPDIEILGGYTDDEGAPSAISIGGLIAQSFHPNDDTLSAHAELIMLKSPLVLNMLEKRMGKGLLQKLATKLMVSAMSGELATGLSTTTFLKMVRKLSGKLETKEFADQWIFRSGCPILTIRYHFNRKKMVIELKIVQECTNDGMIGAVSRFSGPFTVRVQEPGGTFDTEVRIEEKVKQYDIIYHTKYKRIRRRANKKAKRAQENEEDEPDDDDMDDEDDDGRPADMMILDNDMQESGDVRIEEPDRITFEWIRLDPDNNWVCSKSFEQEDFMWNALLRKERDISAQCEAIDALSRIQSLATLTTLTSFARDPNHFYQLRLFAIRALCKFESEEVESTALGNLFKMYTDLFCISENGAAVPKRNNFSSLQEYHMRQAIVRTLIRFVDSRGSSPTSVRRFLVDLLRLNDNSGNEFADGEWVALLVKLVGDVFILRPKEKRAPSAAVALASASGGRGSSRSLFLASTDVEEFEISSREKSQGMTIAGLSHAALSPEDLELFNEAHKQILRQLERDKVLPSHYNSVTTASLEVLLKWQLAGLLPISYFLFMGYTRSGHSRPIRQMAVDCLILLSAMGKQDLTRYLVHLAMSDEDHYFRFAALQSIVNFFEISLFGHKPSVLIEQAVSALSREVVFVADCAVQYVGNSTESRIWRLLLRLFEMAGTLFPERLAQTMPVTLRVPASSQSAATAHAASCADASVPATGSTPTSSSAAGFVPASVSSPSTAEQHSRPTATLVIKAPRPTQAQSDDRAGKRLAEPAVKSEPVHEHTKSRKRTKAAAGMNDSDAEESLSEADPDFMPKSKAKSKAKPKPKQAENPLSQPSPSVMSAPPRAAPSGPPAVPVAPAPDADASAPAIHTPASRPKLLSGAGSAAAPMSSSQSKLCRKALLELRTMNGSIWFLKPVDPVALQIPNYFEIIKHPMDFSTILDNLDSSRYHTADAFVKDVRLVFANAKRFNPPDSQVYRDAESLQAHFEGRWTESILMPAKSVQLAAEPPERMILDDLMIHKDALIFLHPVDPVMYPDYHAKIKRPIDLGTIDARMRRGEYASFEEFDRDIQLLFRNCFTYNSKGTVGYGMGKALESFYQKRCRDHLKNLRAAAQTPMQPRPPKQPKPADQRRASMPYPPSQSPASAMPTAHHATPQVVAPQPTHDHPQASAHAAAQAAPAPALTPNEPKLKLKFALKH
ncbi:hypothetical protein HK105_204860 [Polyrhizophydium stewartii]|uniref:Transcription initiation factor TFIID subunit 2 n=1 Tax=Polyrhizophydium stewartii TaxID=2732419 RepID=A0ABR4N845_9FUNG